MGGPLVVKAQVLSGDRKRAGGILFAKNKTEAKKHIAKLLRSEIEFEPVEHVLIAERLSPVAEYYISFSYDTETRGPVLALSAKGGSGIKRAKVFPVDIILGLQPFMIREYLAEAGWISEDILKTASIVQKLWRLFLDKDLVLAEINPLMKLDDGQFVAADAKVITKTRRQVEYMGGDIAILASGGGASVLNIDALLLAGGKPANYTEYSGNPPAEVVTSLTKEVLSQPGIKGCWVVGGTANFTDIFETLRGFVEGLRQVIPKPTYPIVIRRDGPRQEEAVAMLKKVAAEEGFDFHMYGSETPMVSTAEIIVRLAYNKNPKPEALNPK